MFGWIASLLARKPGAASGEPPQRRLTLNDARHIEAALADLATVGIAFNPGFSGDLKATAAAIAARWQGIWFSHEPTPGDWALIALSAEPGTFANAVHLDDHCFDVADLADYSRMIGEIVALAGDEWRIERVDVKNARCPGASLEWKQPMTVSIEATPPVATFELIHAKDFDWSLVFRLNARLPKEALGRFAIFQDGNATIVFLTLEKLRRLDALCGHEFLCEDAG